MARKPRYLRIALLAIVCVLFQQAALAAYLCPVEQMPANVQALSENCADMEMDRATDNPVLCEQHCNPDRSTAADGVKLSVPPLALPMPAFALVFAQPASLATPRAQGLAVGSDPPPRLRYCSLLI